MATFSVPFVASNPDSWGPINDEGNPNGAPINRFENLPYAPFGRSDRLGRVADFTGRYSGQQRRGGRPIRRDPEEEDGSSQFQLVDTTKTNTTKRFVTPAARRRQHSARLRQVNARRQQSSGMTHEKLTSKTNKNNNWRKGRNTGGRYGSWNNRNNDQQASVSVQQDWVKVEELDLSKLTKQLASTTTTANSTEVPTPEDILWCGFLDPYNEAYDKVTARQPIPLKRMDKKEFYPVTTTDDPVLEKLAIDGNVGTVFCTDAILAHLMTCTRSVAPWDLVLQKLPGGILFLDKRDNSQFDYLTVHETSNNPPTESAEDTMNSPKKLGLEATMIHQNFSQQILKKTGRKEMDLPNPFFDPDDADGMEPASVAFRYRKFALDDSTTVVVRTELHGLVKKTQHMTAFCLNEYTPSTNNNNNTISWRDKIDNHCGAVLATELKNNAFKLAKWTAQSLLAGADQMKIGFVSRVSPKNAYEHVILSTQFYRPKDFATQITLSEGQMWAMVRMFVQLLQKQEDGKYVLMRNPNKALLTLYKVPPETFEDDEE